MRKLVRLVLLVALGVWVWRLILARREPDERAGVSYSDGSSFVLEPSSPGFDRLAAIASDALRS
jgi:hypothetical protein